MEKLPTEIEENILCRLPIETALPAKQVCKPWRILLRSRTDKVGLLFIESYFNKTKINRIKLYYCDEYDPTCGKMNYIYSYDRLKEMDDNGGSIPWYRYIEYDVLGSCNGLVCFQRRRLYLGEPFVICNPIKGEVLYVPKPDMSIGAPDWYPTSISGFGYCHSKNDYKIVQMYSDCRQRKHHVQVFSVAGGEWRNKGSINISPLYPAGIYANGALHWLHQLGKKLRSGHYTVAAFDLVGENFQFIAVPARFKEVDNNHHLKLLGGDNLYLVHAVPDEHCTDIWAYKRKDHNIITNAWDAKKKYNDKNSWHWIKEFSIEWKELQWKDEFIMNREDLHELEPMAITRNGELLILRYNNKTLYCYDRKTSTFKELLNGCTTGCDMINVVPHANSILSFENLEEFIVQGKCD